MGETTRIEWCDHTWSPWFGCTKVHTGCANCYAEADNTRYKRNGGGWGVGAPRVVRKNWDDPVKWSRAAANAGERRRIFISLCDPLDEEAPKEAQARLWQLIRETRKGLSWLLLTKRPERWREVPADVRHLVWLGTSISDQKTADIWVPRLLEADDFARRFLSAEPLLGSVELSCWMWPTCWHWSSAFKTPDEALAAGAYAEQKPQALAAPGRRFIDWVIAGAESGHGARPMDEAWVRSLRDQCVGARVPFFYKQNVVSGHKVPTPPLDGKVWKEFPS